MMSRVVTLLLGNVPSANFCNSAQEYESEELRFLLSFPKSLRQCYAPVSAPERGQHEREVLMS